MLLIGSDHEAIQLKRRDGVGIVIVFKVALTFISLMTSGNNLSCPNLSVFSYKNEILYIACKVRVL